MSKREIIDNILKFNRTAAMEFLDRFKEEDLKAYLERVRTTHPIACLPQFLAQRKLAHRLAQS